MLKQDLEPAYDNTDPVSRNGGEIGSKGAILNMGFACFGEFDIWVLLVSDFVEYETSAWSDEDLKLGLKRRWGSGFLSGVMVPN